MKTATTLAAALILASTTVAQADMTHRHGATCAAKYTSRDLVGADERGIYNGSSTASAQVTCPTHDRVDHASTVLQPDGSTVQGTAYVSATAVRVFGRDLSSTVPFSCYLYSTEEDGFSSWAPTRYMCSASGGCPDATSEFTGSSSIAWSVDPAAVSVHYGVVCSLPPTTSAGNSYVKAIRTTDNGRSTFERHSEGYYRILDILW